MRKHPSLAGDHSTDIPLRRNREFRLLWTGGVTDQLGSEITQIVFPLLLLAITGSAGYAGLLTSAELAIYAIILLPAGVLADRFDRRKIMIFCELSRMALVAVVAATIFLDVAGVPFIILMAILIAGVEGMFAPTQDASLKQIVSTKRLNEAYAVDQARTQAASMVGPIVGGSLFAINRWIPFLGSMISFLISSVLIGFIKRPLQSHDSESREKIKLRGMLEGFRFVFRNNFLRVLTLISMGVMFTLASFPLIYIASLQKLDLSSQLIGVLLASYSLAGILGAIAAPKILALIKPNVLMILGCWIIPVIMVVLAVFTSIPVIVGGACVLFFTLPATTAMARGYLAAITPSELQGRVFASTLMLSAILAPFAPATFGLVFDSAGPFWAFMGMAFVALFPAILSFTKAIRTVQPIESMTTQESAQTS